MTAMEAEDVRHKPFVYRHHELYDRKIRDVLLGLCLFVIGIFTLVIVSGVHHILSMDQVVNNSTSKSPMCNYAHRLLNLSTIPTEEALQRLSPVSETLDKIDWGGAVLLRDLADAIQNRSKQLITQRSVRLARHLRLFYC